MERLSRVICLSIDSSWVVHHGPCGRMAAYCLIAGEKIGEEGNDAMTY